MQNSEGFEKRQASSCLIRPRAEVVGDLRFSQHSYFKTFMKYPLGQNFSRHWGYSSE